MEVRSEIYTFSEESKRKIGATQKGKKCQKKPEKN
jgi:hypothetical protein